MLVGGMLAAVVCLIIRRGWRLVPYVAAITGVWATLPDLPRLFREDLPFIPLAGLIGHKEVEKAMHEFGNIFIFHSWLDQWPDRFVLHGTFIVFAAFVATAVGLNRLNRRNEKTVAELRQHIEVQRQMLSRSESNSRKRKQRDEPRYREAA
jgi:hypothetical protein